MTYDLAAHNNLHSEQGAREGEHPGRSRNPVIKIHDIAWLEFEKPDLNRAGAFAQAFGFAVSARTPTSCSCVGPTRHRRASSSGAAIGPDWSARHSQPRTKTTYCDCPTRPDGPLSGCPTRSAVSPST
ncbi:2,3-dihydroxybiphenyl-1,2-dioxygenase BphC1 domain protein [Mycobacterium kansasii]|uniref:2,3-dihydroxybiphenyl-1,2-dioxygenase BphC1 domain protein n=1 Tax=Mycobacterium kansasii TaxID=1768 RepID=A0A1V3WY76_MYCKA|nr:2,3-dihydroxybiphenyl-1,2-dioxygenase BphC1 domain protein [Mycobacterium kansasii]